MISDSAIAIALVINALGIMGLFWKVSRFIAQAEFKIDLMWADYVSSHDIPPKERRSHKRGIISAD